MAGSFPDRGPFATLVTLRRGVIGAPECPARWSQGEQQKVQPPASTAWPMTLAARRAGHGQGVDGALEAIKGMGLATQRDSKALSWPFPQTSPLAVMLRRNACAGLGQGAGGSRRRGACAVSPTRAARGLPQAPPQPAARPASPLRPLRVRIPIRRERHPSRPRSVAPPPRGRIF